MYKHYALRMVVCTVACMVMWFVTRVTPVYTMVNAWAMCGCASMLMCTAYYAYMVHTTRR